MSDLKFKLWVLCLEMYRTWDDWKENVWSRDLESPHCCNGDMCMCGGASNRELLIYTHSLDATK